MTAHSGFRLIKAPAELIYQAHLDPAAVAVWRPPEGMSAVIHQFDGREGGGYRMAFRYDHAGAAHGKTTEQEDVFSGRFVELVPGRRIVEAVRFDSADAAFAGTMQVVTTLTPEAGGTRVAVRCLDVPPGISQADHEAGIASSLENLAAYAEGLSR